MMSEGFCGLHGRYTMGTIAGCPRCAQINAAPQTYPQWSSATTSADFFGDLLRERDRYRDALRSIAHEIENARDAREDDEIVDLVLHTAISALAVPSPSTDGEKP